MILMIDHYDSFTYNLYQMLVMQTDEIVEVVYYDHITEGHILSLKPSAIILSPGPGTPSEVPESLNVIRTFSGKIPILGVCLGLQCIAQVFGDCVSLAPQIMHGKIESITHNDSLLFVDCPNPMLGTRYHSLSATLALESPLEILAHAKSDDTLMALKHKTHPTYGLQFHPESYGTPHGTQMISNFLSLKEAFHENSLR